jgi:hypothetical protein
MRAIGIAALTVFVLGWLGCLIAWFYTAYQFLRTWIAAPEARRAWRQQQARRGGIIFLMFFLLMLGSGAVAYLIFEVLAAST